MTDPRDTANRDQVEAAEAMAVRVFAGYRTTLPGGADQGQTPDRTPVWLARVAERHNVRVRAGVVETCPHLAPGHGPAVRCLVAWRPGAVVCPDCLARGVTMPPAGSVEDSTCDGCRTFQPDGVRITVIQLDPVSLLHLGLCSTCRADLGADPDS